MEHSQSCTNFKLTYFHSCNKNGLQVSQTQHSDLSHNELLYNSAGNNSILPNKLIRRRKLQRQQSIVDVDEKYVADLEEERKDPNILSRLQRQNQLSHLCSNGAMNLKFHNRQELWNNGKISCTLHHLGAENPLLISNEHSTEKKHEYINNLMRDISVQSDSSRYSSVDSLLESRKPDPEAILINLGFGPIGSEDILSRIPKRFLKPSKVRGIDTEAFVKRLQLVSSLAETSVMGYRGLTGNPDVPPSSIVAKIMERFEVNQRKKSVDFGEHTIQ